VGGADEGLGARVRRGKLEKIPYILVVGDDDVTAGTVGVNARENGGPPVRDVPVDAFIDRLQSEVVSHLAPSTASTSAT
jgi:threonyl-tRNA synthetase